MSTQDQPDIDESDVGDRCGFCAAPLQPDQEVCAACGRSVAEGGEFRLRRPLWMKIVALAVLAALGVALVAWLVGLLRQA